MGLAAAVHRMRNAVSGMSSSAIPYVAPFGVFVGFMFLEKVLPFPPQSLYPIRCMVTLAVIALVSRPVIRLRPSKTLSSFLLGVGVFMIWVGPDWMWGYRDHWLFSNSLTGSAVSSLPPGAKTDWIFLSFRVFGSAVLVPILEELFWRGWMMRWIIRSDFLNVPLGTFTRSSFWIVALLFASEHGPYWEVGLVAGIAYNGWLVRTRNLADCILAHAATNAMLAGYVLACSQWQYWL